MLPNIVCGTSMGSIVAAFLATRTDTEALESLEKLDDLYTHVGPEGGPMQGTKLERIGGILRRGYVYTHQEMLEALSWFTKGMTFQEAYEKTGKSVTITCTPSKTEAARGLPPMLLNHITTPTVTIDSACLASSCVPCLVLPAILMVKTSDGIKPYEGVARTTTIDESFEPLDTVRMRDGSFESDVPISAISAYFNTQFNIVSQVNPHIIPFYFYPEGGVGMPVRWPWRKYRGGFIGSVLVSWFKEDMLKLLRVMKTGGLLFNVFGVDWSYLFLQDCQGDVTIVPHASNYDFWRIMDNLGSRQELDTKVRQSERATWRNFSMIRTRMRIQRALESLDGMLHLRQRPLGAHD